MHALRFRHWLAAAVVALFGMMAAPVGAVAPSILFYQNSQDEARSFDVNTLAAGPTVTGFLGAIAGNGRNIQADGDDGLLWYSDTSGNIRSKVIAGGADGPMIPSGTFAGANSGADRHFCIDPFTNRLYYSVTDNSVQIIDLATATEVGTYPSNSFLGAAIGGFRHATIDSVNRLFYYAATDNFIYSFALDDPSVAGPTVPSNEIAGADAGGYRHLIYDPNSGLIWYSVTDGTVHSIDPVTGVAGPTLGGGNFTDVLGAGRIITMTYDVLPEGDSAALAGAALVALVALRRGRTRTP